MKRFAAMGTVLYINSIVTQKPDLSRVRTFTHKLIRKSRSIFKGLQKVDGGFWVCSPFSMPVHHIGGARRINDALLWRQINHACRRLRFSVPIVWVACPTACNLALRLNKRSLVYQRTDRFEDYPNVDAQMIIDCDRSLKTSADVTLFVNRALYDQEHKQCRRAVYLDQGVDFDLFASAEQNPTTPPDIAGIRNPIVGYFGAIDEHKFDTRLVETAAERLPGVSFVLVGSVSIDCSRLAAKKNVYMLGQKPYELIPHYGKFFDVAIWPAPKNRWTEVANPIKLKEYLSLGKPVVCSSACTELAEYSDVLYQADTTQEFVESIRRAIAEDDSERIERRKELARKHSWDAKARSLLEVLAQCH